MNANATKRRICALIVFALAIVGLDQLTKLLVVQQIPYSATVPVLPGVVHLTYVRNTGAAFSVLSGMRWLFLALVAVFLAALVILVKKRVLTKPVELWCMAAIAGGAVGNAIDRALYGSVVDMIEVEFIRFAVFNVADSFITVGALVFAVYVLFSAGGKKESDDAADQ